MTAHFTESSSDSGFLKGEDLYLSKSFCDIELMATSGSGPCDVYRGKRMGKWHVLKCLKPAYADKTEYQALLKKEFELGYHLNHPNIVRILSMEEVEGLGVCIVMEYVEGRTLRQAMLQGLTADQGTAMALQLCHALSYIHARQMVHRDLKPENIMLTYSGNDVKLIDFGLSDATDYAILKQPAGTPKYAAPEQHSPTLAADPRWDIYALGITMMELPALSRRMRSVARRCCKQQPEERYQTAADVKAALLNKRRTPWVPVGVLLCAALGLGAAYTMYNKTSKPMVETVVTKTEATADTLSTAIVKPADPTRPTAKEENNNIVGVPIATSVSPDVAFFLNQTAIPTEVQHEPRFVHLAEYAYSVTTHLLKTQSINSNAEAEAFSYAQKEIKMTMGTDRAKADEYLRYLDVLTQLFAEDYRATHFSQQAATSKEPDREILHQLEQYAEKWVPFSYQITNLANGTPSQTNEQEVLADMEREVQHLVGKDHPHYDAYLKHARAAAQRVMGERRELWKSANMWVE